jgi:hypothetical protein
MDKLAETEIHELDQAGNVQRKWLHKPGQAPVRLPSSSRINRESLLILLTAVSHAPFQRDVNPQDPF